MVPIDVHKVMDECMKLPYVIDAFVDDNDDVENDLVQNLFLLIHEYANLNKSF